MIYLGDSSLRRGLPRTPGGELWPPAPTGADRARDTASTVDAEQRASVGGAPERALPQAGDVVGPPRVSDPPVPTPALDATEVPLRRGLPRVRGAEPWPPLGATHTPGVLAPAAIPANDVSTDSPRQQPASAPEAVAAAPASAAPGVAADGALRRGLPRVTGGQAWPSVGTAPARPSTAPLQATTSADLPRSTAAETSEVLEAPEVPVTPVAASETFVDSPPRQVSNATAGPPAVTERPAPEKTAPAGAAAPSAAAVAAPTEPGRSVPLLNRLPRFALEVVAGVAALLVVALVVVLVARWFVSLDFVADFLATYPGEYHLPDGAEQGFPAWLQWQHFLNTFLIVLIIRSGLQVRYEERPSAFWTPKWNSKRKISLALWFHQFLDILWLLNGVLFIVLLFATTQWMRVVPTSWEVFPNAVSAGLRYVSLEWPTENGWVNYNSLQQIMYFLVIFVAAPLAAVTGVRMSGIWPARAKTLSRWYPLELARAIHFPVMLFFVGFIIVHVALVFATGALRNLNHMYGGQDAVNWVGFGIFFVSLLVIIGAWIAARPLLLASVAGLFGRVSNR